MNIFQNNYTKLLDKNERAEIENLSLEEKLGMSIPEFCENMKRENPASNWLEHLLKLLQTAFFIFTSIYTFEFFTVALSSPSNFGILMEDVILVSLIIILDYGIDYLLDRFIFDPNSLKHKFLICIRNFIWGLFFIFIFCFDIEPYYLIHGNGWVIETILLLITFLLWIGNNYYCNKQSEKYNWQ